MSRRAKGLSLVTGLCALAAWREQPDWRAWLVGEVAHRFNDLQVLPAAKQRAARELRELVDQRWRNPHAPRLIDRMANEVDEDRLAAITTKVAQLLSQRPELDQQATEKP